MGDRSGQAATSRVRWHQRIDAAAARRVRWLFAVAYSAVGFSLYFALGVVADRGLGLTPLIFLTAGLLFVLTTLTYVEGGGDVPRAGRLDRRSPGYAFNELVSFIAGWAILIDYMIVIALAAITVPHYLTPISDSFASGGEVAIAGGGDRRSPRASTSPG